MTYCKRFLLETNLTFLLHMENIKATHFPMRFVTKYSRSLIFLYNKGVHENGFKKGKKNHIYLNSSIVIHFQGCEIRQVYHIIDKPIAIWGPNGRKHIFYV